MTLLVATDFSPGAGEAGLLGAALGKKLGEPVLLVHATREPEGAQALLDAEAARLSRAGASVQPVLLEGDPEVAIAAHAAHAQARLIIASALGARRSPLRGLGRVVEALAHRPPCPTLVVRAATPLLEWAEGSRPLRVVVGDDFGTQADAALRWLRVLRQIGPCEVTVAHLYWPVAEHVRLGMLGAHAAPASVESSLRRDLEARLESFGESGANLRIAASYGRAADPLLQIAREERADLLVLGTHGRGRLQRAWQGSVSHACLNLSPIAVAAVPAAEERDVAAAGIPSVHKVLACTDFSAMGNLAVAHACSVLPRGGQLIVLHAIEVTGAIPGEAPVSAEDRRAAAERLAALVPAEAAGRGIAVRTEVVVGAHAARLICQQAARDEVDLICLASHGRTGVKRLVLGSVAAEVIARSVRPVLVVRSRGG